MNTDDSTPKIGGQEAAELAIVAAIDKELENNPPEGSYDTTACAYNVMDKLDRSSLSHAAWRYITGVVQRRLLREIKSEARADARTGLLAMPGFDLVSPWVKIEGVITPLKKVSVEQHRMSVKERARRIRNMQYPRWSEERMKAEKAALAQERKLDRKVAPFTEPEMQMGIAIELYESTAREVAAKHTNQKKRATPSR